MTNRLPEFLQLSRFKIADEDIIRGNLHCEPEVIQPSVIITPHWGPEVFDEAVDSIEDAGTGVWLLKAAGKTITLVRSGIGAPLTGDAALTLGCTPCRTLLFTGSMAGLTPDSHIGDLCVVERSVCGDGYSRYLNADIVPRDCFFQTAEPDKGLTGLVQKQAELLCREGGVTLHRGTIISIDSLLPEFFRLEHFARDLKCIGVEMETAAVFKAAKMVGIKACALLIISDLPLQNKTLYSGRTREELARCHDNKRTILARAIINSLIQ